MLIFVWGMIDITHHKLRKEFFLVTFNHWSFVLTSLDRKCQPPAAYIGPRWLFQCVPTIFLPNHDYLPPSGAPKRDARGSRKVVAVVVPPSQLGVTSAGWPPRCEGARVERWVQQGGL